MLDNINNAIDTLSTTWPFFAAAFGLFILFCIVFKIYENYTARRKAVRLKKPCGYSHGAIRRGF